MDVFDTSTIMRKLRRCEGGRDWVRVSEIMARITAVTCPVRSNTTHRKVTRCASGSSDRRRDAATEKDDRDSNEHGACPMHHIKHIVTSQAPLFAPDAWQKRSHEWQPKGQ